MPQTPSVWSRIRKGRLVQVLAVYLGASWLVIQVAGALTNALALPAWVSPLVVLLLLVGLLVVLATAWVQSSPLVVDSPAAEPVPAPWALDVRDMGRAVRGGRLPHLTWTRALAGGAVAFSLLFGLAGSWVLFAGRSPGAAPLSAEAGVAPGLAVLPFEARGLDEDLWSAGMVDLLTTNLDGVGGLRTIDSRTVLARWRESGAQATGDLAAVLQVAASAGARWAVVGSSVGVGDRVRLSARLYDVDARAERGSAQVEGAPGNVLALVDALSIDLVRDLIQERQLPQVPARSLAAITTSSVPALRAYLRGEAANRQSDFLAAIRAYEEALEADSTFALAAHRLGMAYGWTEARGSERAERFRTLAGEMSDRLPERDAALMRAFNLAMHDGDPAGIDALERLARTYPDDPEIWTMLGEARYHLGPMALVPAHTALGAFENAIALDSSYAPAYIHPFELKIGSGRDSASASRLLDAYSRYGARDRTRIAAMRLAFDLAYGDHATPPTADTIAVQTLGYTFGTLDRGGFGSRAAIYRLATIHALPAEVAPPPVLTGRIAGLDAELGRPGRVLEAWPRLPDWSRAWAALVMTESCGSGCLPDHAARDVMQVDSTTPALAAVVAGLVAIHRGAASGPSAHSAAHARLRELATRPGPDSAVAGPAADALRALHRWSEGRVEEAIHELERVRRQTIGFATPDFNEQVRVWLGRLEAERGRHEEALVYLASAFSSIQARLLMAESFEALARPDSAAVAYADVLRVWTDAEPDFEPAERARRGLARVLAES
jgi:tetratricopeptide (TPR) repeat protein